MEKYRCTICGYVHEGEIDETFTCLVCKQPYIKFEKIIETPIKNKYEGKKQ